MKPHKHAALIKAWADGAQIEVQIEYSNPPRWVPATAPSWERNLEYRIKPHKWQHCIDAQKAGKVIEGREPGEDWRVHVFGKWRFDSQDMEYRIRPEGLRYRVALMEGYTVVVNNDPDHNHMERLPHFVRWVTDWVEVTREPEPA